MKKRNMTLFTAIAGLALTAPAFAASTFSNAIDTDWNTAGNWTNGVPGVSDGNVTINGSAIVSSAAPDIGGVLNVSNGSELIINANFGHASNLTNSDVWLGGTVTQNTGDVYFSDDTRPSGGGTYNMNGGTFVNRDYWRFDSAGNINITGGSFTIGSLLNMNGNSSELKVVGDAATSISFGTVGGFGAGTLDLIFKDGGITTIDVSGSANLPGTLNVTLDAGFSPVAGDYTLISAGSLNGSIGTENLPAGWSVATVGNDLVLTAVPEPSAMSLLAIGGLALLRRRRA